MKELKRFYLAAMMVVMFAMTGCGAVSDEVREDIKPSDGQEENSQSDDGDILAETEDEFLFRFVVRDAYDISEEGAVVTGFVYRGTMRAGDTALLLKEDGTIIEVMVKQIEVKDEEADEIVSTDEVKGVEEGTPAGVWLEGIESEQIDNADILLGIRDT